MPFTPATVATLLFLNQPGTCVPPLGTLHLLFLWPGVLFLQICNLLPQFKCYLLSEAFTDHLLSRVKSLISFSNPLLYFAPQQSTLLHSSKQVKCYYLRAVWHGPYENGNAIKAGICACSFSAMS